MDKWVRCAEAKRLLKITQNSKSFKDRINYDNHFKKDGNGIKTQERSAFNW